MNKVYPDARSALEGVVQLLQSMKLIRKASNPDLKLLGVLATMYDKRLRLANQVCDDIKRHFQELVFRTVIHRNVKLSEAPGHGVPVILYDADSTGAANYLELAKEIIKRNANKPQTPNSRNVGNAKK